MEKSKVLMEESLILPWIPGATTIPYNFSNPHLIYTISRINSVSISFEAIFNFVANGR